MGAGPRRAMGGMTPVVPGPAGPGDDQVETLPLQLAGPVPEPGHSPGVPETDQAVLIRKNNGVPAPGHQAAAEPILRKAQLHAAPSLIFAIPPLVIHDTGKLSPSSGIEPAGKYICPPVPPAIDFFPALLYL
jgi:hypothetical protein